MRRVRRRVIEHLVRISRSLQGGTEREGALISVCEEGATVGVVMWLEALVCGERCATVCHKMRECIEEFRDHSTARNLVLKTHDTEGPSSKMERRVNRVAKTKQAYLNQGESIYECMTTNI